jgi:hypothetical protein
VEYTASDSTLTFPTIGTKASWKVYVNPAVRTLGASTRFTAREVSTDSISAPKESSVGVNAAPPNTELFIPSTVQMRNPRMEDCTFAVRRKVSITLYCRMGVKDMETQQKLRRVGSAEG